MKQSKVASTPPPPPAKPAIRGPRYRYFSSTPSTVTLRMRDLQVPEKARTPSYDSERFVDLPCGDIFNGVMPKIRLSRLAALAPECVTAAGLPDEAVRVCSARLALAYVVTEGREVIEEPAAPVPPEPVPDKTPAPAKEDPLPTELGKKGDLEKKPHPESSAPPEPKILPHGKTAQAPEAPKAPQADKPATTTGFVPALPTVVSAPKPTEETPSGEKPVVAPSAPLPAPAAAPASPAARDLPPAVSTPANAETPPLAHKDPSSERQTGPSPAGKREQEPVGSASTQAENKPADVDSPLPSSAGAAPGKSDDLDKPVLPPKKPFSLFPMFRRKEASDDKPPAAVPRNRIELPAPKRPSTPFTDQPAAPKEEPKVIEAELVEPKPTGPRPALPKPRFEPRPAAAGAGPEAVPARADEPAPAVPPTSLPPASSAERSPQAGTASPPPRPAPTMPPLAVAMPQDTRENPPSEKKSPPSVPQPPVIPAARSAGKGPAEPAAAQERSGEKPVEVPAKKPEPAEKPPAAPMPGALLVETEHLARKDAPADIPDQDTLQAIFHTEEFLSVDRIMELCGTLPGIHSCILSHGEGVIASHNTPDSVDIVSLSAHALEMIKAMRTSSAKMGIGAVPAVTVHSEKGPITFFHQDDLCLLVMHKDRGFVPGVREKLQAVVDELTRAKLPVRLGDRKPITVLRE